MGTHARLSVRITPACAGKSRRTSSEPPRAQDHPRVCGEKMQSLSVWPMIAGSPPRVRGKAMTATAGDHPTRITPACAGKSYTSQHPLHSTGSPPRVRGKASIAEEIADVERITPACAGKRTASTTRLLFARDHPRVCGEKSCAQLGTSSRLGSPPRVRGKGLSGWCTISLQRITPACAGKSAGGLSIGVIERDHPRVCGEKRLNWPLQIRLIGSPPRVRGKGRLCDAQRIRRRITPACAGKRKKQHFTIFISKDHPRVCGEKSIKGLLRSKTAGSPPRVRGKV